MNKRLERFLDQMKYAHAQRAIYGVAYEISESYAAESEPREKTLDKDRDTCNDYYDSQDLTYSEKENEHAESGVHSVERKQ